MQTQPFRQEDTMAEMSPLRRRMLKDMAIRMLSPAPQRTRLHAVPKFSCRFGRSPDRLDIIVQRIMGRRGFAQCWHERIRALLRQPQLNAVSKMSPCIDDCCQSIYG